METAKKICQWKLFLALAIVLTVYMFLMAVNAEASATKLIVNGTTINTKVITEDGYTYVPINQIVKKMGDKFDYIRSSGFYVIKTEKKNYYITIGKSVAYDDEFNEYPLATKTVDEKKVPAGAIAFQVNGELFIPINFVSDTLKYPVTIKGNTIYVGKVTETKTATTSSTKKTSKKQYYYLNKYPCPVGWEPPKIKSKVTKSNTKNYKIINKELGLDHGIYKDTWILVDEDKNNKGYDVLIQYRAWYSSNTKDKQLYEYNTIPYISEELFNFYMPKKGSQLKEIIEVVGGLKDDHGKYDNIKIGKPFKLGKYKVKLQTVRHYLQILIDYR